MSQPLSRTYPLYARPRSRPAWPASIFASLVLHGVVWTFLILGAAFTTGNPIILEVFHAELSPEDHEALRTRRDAGAGERGLELPPRGDARPSPSRRSTAAGAPVAPSRPVPVQPPSEAMAAGAPTRTSGPPDSESTPPAAIAVKAEDSFGLAGSPAAVSVVSSQLPQPEPAAAPPAAPAAVPSAPLAPAGAFAVSPDATWDQPSSGTAVAVAPSSSQIPRERETAGMPPPKALPPRAAARTPEQLEARETRREPTPAAAPVVAARSTSPSAQEHLALAGPDVLTSAPSPLTTSVPAVTGPPVSGLPAREAGDNAPAAQTLKPAAEPRSTPRPVDPNVSPSVDPFAGAAPFPKSVDLGATSAPTIGIPSRPSTAAPASIAQRAEAAAPAKPPTASKPEPPRPAPPVTTPIPVAPITSIDGGRFEWRVLESTPASPVKEAAAPGTPATPLTPVTASSSTGAVVAPGSVVAAGGGAAAMPGVPPGTSSHGTSEGWQGPAVAAPNGGVVAREGSRPGDATAGGFSSGAAPAAEPAAGRTGAAAGAATTAVPGTTAGTGTGATPGMPAGTATGTHAETAPGTGTGTATGTAPASGTSPAPKRGRIAINSPHNGFRLGPDDAPVVVVEGEVDDPAATSVWLFANDVRVRAPVTERRFRHVLPVLESEVRLQAETSAAGDRLIRSQPVTIHAGTVTETAAVIVVDARDAQVTGTWRGTPARVDVPVYPVGVKTVDPASALPRGVFYIRSLREGVYTLSIRSSSTLPESTVLYVRAEGQVTAHPVTAATHGLSRIVAKLLMPFGVMWEQNTWFTGRSEGSDTITKFRFPEGVTWTERKSDVRR